MEVKLGNPVDPRVCMYVCTCGVVVECIAVRPDLNSVVGGSPCSASSAARAYTPGALTVTQLHTQTTPALLHLIRSILSLSLSPSVSLSPSLSLSLSSLWIIPYTTMCYKPVYLL